MRIVVHQLVKMYPLCNVITVITSRLGNAQVVWECLMSYIRNLCLILTSNGFVVFAVQTHHQESQPVNQVIWIRFWKE